METVAPVSPNADIVALQAQIEAQNKTLSDLLAKSTSTDGTPAAVSAAKAGDVPVARKLRMQEAIKAFDPLKGKGLGIAKLAIAAALRANNPELTYAEIEKKLDLPEGVLKASTTAEVDAVYARRSQVDAVGKAMGDGQPLAGGAWAFDEYAGDFIEVLRPLLTLVNAGVETIPMSRQSLTIPRQSASLAGNWMGESQAMTATNPQTDTAQLQLKKWAALVAISNDLLHDAAGIESLVRTDLMEQAKRALDLAMIRGAGTAYTPRGVRNWTVAANVFGSAAGAGANTLTTALADLWKAQNAIEQANVPLVKPVFLASPRTKNGLAQLRDGVGRPYFDLTLGSSKPTINGVPLLVTAQIPNNLSGGGSGGSLESELTLVEITQLILGMGLLPSIEASREAAYFDGTANQAAFSRDETVIRLIMRADFIMRHQEAASVVTGITLS